MDGTDLRHQLDAKIPENVIEVREQAGRQLSYLSGAYVINRLNEVVGHGNWSYSITRLEKVFEGKVSQRSGDAFATSYIAMVRLTAHLDGHLCHYEDVGYGDGTDRSNPGKAHELAVKEAVTDGIKRAAKNLGRSMGLALYFKDGEDYVEFERPTIPLPAKGAASPGPAEDRGGRQGLESSIRSAYSLLHGQGKITGDAFKNQYLRGKRMDQLTPEELQQVYDQVKRDFPAELGREAQTAAGAGPESAQGAPTPAPGRRGKQKQSERRTNQ